ncbi:hypothetical protein [Arachnia propionica]|jgi:protein containing ATP/GTP-binding site motif A|nr:hypothetical protein [Arachnia propionica]QCT38427.1 hypothetical protein FBF34_10915 [Arachnia propionica]QUC11982.1 hypothetical protein J5A53_04630 [Arachnia propionica]
MRLLVKTFGWHYPAVKGTFASSKQTPALMTVLTNTDLDYHGDPLGVNLWTNQAILESAWTLYSDGWINSPNQCILGALGTAKSTYVKTILLRSMMHGGRAVVFDRKRQAQNGRTQGEYVKLADTIGGTTIRFHQARDQGTRINILDPAIVQMTTAGSDSLLGQDRLLIMVAEAALETKLTSEQRHALKVAHQSALDAADLKRRVPVLADVIHALQNPCTTGVKGVDLDRLREWGLPVVLGLMRYIDGDLAGLIDGETTGPGGEPVDFASRLLVFDTSALEYGSTALGLMMTVTTAFLLSVWVNMPGEKSLVIEEAYSADGIGVVPAMLRDLAKRTRGVGASMISVFHHVSDVPVDSPLRSLITESELVSIFRQDKGADVDAAVELLSLDPSTRQLIQELPRGVHLRKRGPKLPLVVAELTRTNLDRYITFTDDAYVVNN